MRHGESEANLNDIHGLPKSPLTKKGKQQAAAAARKFRNISLSSVQASDYDRSSKTAQYFTSRPIAQRPGFNERSFGKLEFELGQIQLKAFKKHLDHLPKGSRSHIRFVADMESDLDAYSRFQESLLPAILSSPGNILIVSHSNIMRIFMDYSGLMTLPPGAISNCGYFKLGWEKDNLTLMEHNGIKTK